MYTCNYDNTAGLDYLSSPTGAIEEAQRLAAEAFGAHCTWFLVNGTTTGIHAAVMATCGPGDTLIGARNCHLSAVSAMVLSGVGDLRAHVCRDVDILCRCPWQDVVEILYPPVSC